MIKISEKNYSRKENITVEFFFRLTKDRFNLKLVNNVTEIEKIMITDQNLHRPGLALAGFVDLFSHHRIQIMGNTEMKYLGQLSHEKRYSSIKTLLEFGVPCIVITDNNQPFSELVELATLNNTPIFCTDFCTTKISYLISDFLDDQFSPRVSLHGSFVDVYGVGLLFVGKSGIGKSEVALDLVERGHRIVADDVVILTKKGEGILMGSGTEIVEHFMEVRGIGIVDIKSMFGIRAIRFQKRLEIIIELQIWDSTTEYTRTGLDENFINIADVNVKYIKVPIVPGKNLTVISEVIALNYLLKHNTGYDSAKVLNERLMEKLKNKTQGGVNRTVNYFEHDFE